MLLVLNFSAHYLRKLLLLVFLFVSLCAAGQSFSFSFQRAPLPTVFSQIEQRSDYQFIYTEELLARSAPVSFTVKDVSIDSILKLCFRQQPLDYTMEGKHIVVRKKIIEKPVAVFHEIRGQVFNEKGEPVPGITVTIKQTNMATATDANGEFIFKNVPEKVALLVTGVEIIPQEIEIGQSFYVRIMVLPRINVLDETVVIGYGKTTRRLNTGSVGKVTSEEISKQPVSNPLAAIQGKVPGVTIVQSNGVPGSSFRVLIRGRNSLQQGTEPLFVIDGVPFAPNNNNSNELSSLAASDIGVGLSPLNSINPSDIESIEILKDADATAIYGSRGANGVVIITTKKGLAGKTKLDVTAYSGISQIARFPKYMNTAEYIKMRKEAFQNDGISPDATNAPDLLLWDTSRYTNFEKLLIGGKAHTNDLQVGLTGGNTNTQFTVGFGLHNETTVLPGNLADNRASVKTGITHQSQDKKFSLNLSSYYAFEKNNLISSSSLTRYISLSPNLPPLFDSVGKLKWEQAGVSYENPLAYLQRKYSMRTDNLLSNLQLAYTPFPGLSLKSNFGFNSFLTNELGLFPKGSQNPSTNPTASSQFANRARKSWIVEPQIEYFIRSSKHKLTALSGMTLQQVNNEGTSINANGYTDDALIESLTGAASITTMNDYSRYRYLAFFSRVNYNYSDRYIVNLSGRRDGSSRFSPENRFNNYGSVGVAWLFSNEKFIKNKPSWLSFGKIRGSYGVIGNDQIGDYKYLDAWAVNYYPYQSTTGLFPVGLYNANYQWESTRKLELTSELGFLRDKILLTTTYYNNRSGNQLINYILPTQTGSQSILQNFPALIQNSGWEFSVITKNISTKSVEWTTSFNISIPRNKLVSFPNIQQTSYRYIFVPGQSLNLIYGYKNTGIDPNKGLYTFSDVNKDGTISYPEDITVNGNLDPKYFGGLSNSIKIKGFDFDFFFEFKKQLGQSYKATFLALTPGTMNNQLALLNSRWPNPSNNPENMKTTTISFGPAYESINNLIMSDGIFEDASFVRLRNVSVSYSLPKNLISKVKFEKARIFLHCQNVFTITKFKGPDPESQSLFSLPPLRTFVAGIQITL